jgi:MraZ protein
VAFYVSVAELLYAGITDSVFDIGDRLPAIRLMAGLFGTSEILSIDQDGRTILPEHLREHAGITTHITFVGLGDKFQMWEPKRFETHLAGARQKVRDLRKLLGAGRRGSGGPEGARE